MGDELGPRPGDASSCVVAATLLDLKAARLLPAAEVEDEEDLALLEARDLLFARLLQYRAYKQAAAYLAELGGRRRPGGTPGPSAWSRGSPSCCPRCCSASAPQRFADAGRGAMHPQARADGVDRPRPRAAGQRPRAAGDPRATGCAAPATATLPRAWSPTARRTLEVVARFLALLELYREGVVAFDQVTAAGRAARAVDRRPADDEATDADEEYA